MGFKTEIKTFGDPKYYPNGVTFGSLTEAKQYGQNKLAAWTMAEDFRVVEVSDAANYRWDSAQGLVSVEA